MVKKMTLFCENCGKPFVSKVYNRKMCDACQKESRQQSSKDRTKKHTNTQKSEERHKALLDICRKADAEGLSYAKYVQKYGV